MGQGSRGVRFIIDVPFHLILPPIPQEDKGGITLDT